MKVKATQIGLAALATAAMLAGASTAFAQSTVTGTLNSGGSSGYSTGTSGNTVTGTVAPSNTSGATTGTNTGTGSSGTTGSTGTTGATGSTSSSGSVLGTGTSNPSVPNTGAGGDVATTMLVLAISGIAALGGVRLMTRRAA